MKKIFSFFTAVLFAGSMMAQAFDHGLYVPANATVEVATEVGTTASVNTTTGDLTINIAGQHTSWGDWGNQIKLTTGITAMDATKNYEIGFKAVASTANCPASHVKIFDDNELFHSTEEVYTTTVKEFSTVVRGVAATNGIIVWSFTYAAAQTVTISDIYVKESSAPIVEDPKPTTAPAAPTADAATVLSVYSNTYPAAAPFGFLEGWGQSTSLEELNLDGNNVLYYKNFNYLGWGCQGTPIDASTCTGLHMDIWAGEAGQIRVFAIYGGEGLSTDDTHGKVVTLNEGWNSIDFDLATDFAGLNLESIFQFKFDEANGAKFFAFDNVYFTGYTAPLVTYTSLADTYKKADKDTVVLKDFEVVYVNGGYCYIKDVTASGLIFKNNYGLVAGDKVAKGLEAKIKVYNNLYELDPITAKADLTVTAGTPAQPVNATAAPTAADNKYMVYKGVKFLKEFMGKKVTANRTVPGIFKGDTITFYNTFSLDSVAIDTTKTYDVVGFNSCFKSDLQIAVASFEEHPEAVDECAGEHGLYDPAKAVINETYLAPGWNAGAGADHTASLEGADIVLHVGAQGYGDMWNGQVFVNPGFSFTPGKAYHYEFDLVSSGKVCITVKVNDNDNYAFFAKQYNDINVGGGTWHFSTDSVFANDSLKTSRGPLVFGFGWTDANQDVIIKCIKITEIGDAPQPVEEKMYIKHPWGTGKDEDWAWQEMSECKFKNVKAWTYTGAWGGAGFNIADNAEGTNASWYATTDIQFLDADQILVAEPAVGTANCEFYFVPSFIGGIVTPAYVVVPAAEGFENNQEAVKAVKVIENGKVVIIKNGVRYNALGAQL